MVIHRSTTFLTPGRIAILSIILTIATGAYLLSLPCSQKIPLTWIDLIFTSISATTVTGLLTVPMDSFTSFGHGIILVLIQLGGLGVITLSIFLMSFFLELGLSQQPVSKHLTAQPGGWVENFKSTRKLMTFILTFTLIAELIGATLFWHSLPAEYSGLRRIFYAVFHSVSSFCNAGFTLFPDSMEALSTNIPFLLTTLLLVTIGGFGFMSIHEVGRYFKRHNKRHLSLQTHAIIATTILITLVTTVLFWVLEYGHTLTGVPTITTAVNILFDAACARSAGFTTLDVSTLRLATIFIIMMVSFIGSSPGSTGSGVKTTTFAIFMATVRAVISGRRSVTYKGFKIPNSEVFNAFAVLLLSLTWISIAIFVLLLTEEGWHFLDVMFETFSAFSNLGLSTGITPYLSIAGKFFIMSIMIIGRVGSITLLIALRQKHAAEDLKYLEEQII